MRLLEEKLGNEETGTYHLYLTDLPAQQLPAQDLQAVYALRWEGELLFKLSR